MKTFWALVLVLALSPWPALGQVEWPDLSGSWALFQVISDYWEAPLLGERPRRIYQIAKIWVDQDGANLVLSSEEVCTMIFDMGTSLVQISVTPAFLSAVRIDALKGRLSQSGEAIILEIPEFVIANGVILADLNLESLPNTADDPRVVDLDSDGKPGFTVKIRVFGLIPGETYVVQRLRQSYRGTLVGEDLVRGTISWVDEQVTLGASASFFLLSGKGRPDPDPNRSFFVMRRISGSETCTELSKLFREELGR